MKKLMVIAGVVALAGMMVGCASNKAAKEGKPKMTAEEQEEAQKKHVDKLTNKIKDWQKKRTPVVVLKSKIEVKAVGAMLEALDTVPFSLYKPMAEKCDFAFNDWKYHVILATYLGDVEGYMAQGKSKAEAQKLAKAGISPEDWAKTKEYIAKAQKTDWDEFKAWCAKFGEDLAAATAKFATESVNAPKQALEILKREGVSGMALMTIPKQVNSDLEVIGGQLKNTEKAFGYYRQIMKEIEADSKKTTAEQLEETENAV